ncbi:MAG: nucleotidyl transferase AbiEii/AbiGii toxin family protein [Thermoflexus sp.]|nr:nucleotidyl transferase AbiEii/AbiGii toxin family protein [Thermoflexus sp.]MDT7883666.1 nucleotidyl transferase AbiEii/AbiGii toxin family protein [Thermoflexus sp.]MDT7947348.1 nucleotidyl transferase AbiEii/AbiGii toxin family protein [Thermoflexus sp.]
MLKAFFAMPLSRGFVLTGGTALAAFYLFHRISEDLDLFTPNPEDMQDVERGVSDIARREGLTVELERRSPFFCRAFLFESRDQPPLKVDLVYDPGPWFGSPMEWEGIRVDSLENIAANKVTALMSRGEMRDFIDLYFILRETDLDFDHLLILARQKDPGLREFYLAGFIYQQLKRMRALPPLLKPLDLEDFRRFYTDLAEALARRSRPDGPGGREGRSDIPARSPFASNSLMRDEGWPERCGS